MSVDARLAELERQNAQIMSVLASVREVLEAQDDTTKNMIKHSESMSGIVQTAVNDLNFITMFTYWLTHVLERVEHVVPVGTTDLVLNSVEDAMDITRASFIQTFETLREDT